MTVTREMLTAYADGELGPGEMAQVEAAIRADPELAKEVEAHRSLRTTLSAHFAPILEMPVPDRLQAALAKPKNIIDFADARRAREEKATMRATVPRWAMGGAVAASLALGAIIGSQIPGGETVRSVDGQLVASGALNKALTSQLASTQGDAAPVRILLSFKNGDGRYCRGFEAGATAGIACRAGDKWDLVRTQANAPGETGIYRQAGSAAAGIMAAAQEMAAGGALDADAERAARDSSWQR